MDSQKVILRSFQSLVLLSFIAISVAAANFCYPAINGVAKGMTLFAYPITFIVSFLIGGIAMRAILWPLESFFNSYQVPRVMSFLKSKAEDGDWQTTANFLLFNRGGLSITEVGGHLDPTRWPADALGHFFAKNKLVADPFYRFHFEWLAEGDVSGHESKPDDISISASIEERPVDQSSGRFASKMESIKLEVIKEGRNERLEKRKAELEKVLKRNNREKQKVVEDINDLTEIMRKLPVFIFSEIRQLLENRAQSGELLPINWDISSEFKGIRPLFYTLELNSRFFEESYLLNETRDNFEQKLEAAWFVENWLISDGRSGLQVLLRELELCLSFYFARSKETPEKHYGLNVQIMDFKKVSERKDYVQFHTGLYGGRKKDKPIIKTLN